MSGPSRWIRLDIGWDDSDWIADLSLGGQLAWIKLLGYVKGSGIRGEAKSLTVRRACEKWKVPQRDIDAMLAAARKDGALEGENGTWKLANWDRYQETDRTVAERMRRYRSRDVTP